MNFDYTLYLVTDRQLMSCDSLTEAVEQAILGGCTMIQLREKELPSLEFYNQAVAVKQVTERYHIPLKFLHLEPFSQFSCLPQDNHLCEQHQNK